MWYHCVSWGVGTFTRGSLNGIAVRLARIEKLPENNSMAFWSGETLEQRLPTLVEPFDVKNVDCAAYTLHVGDEYYVSPDRKIPSPLRCSVKRLKHERAFTIPPGQFAFLVTEESVRVPDDAIAFISIKARLKFNGLIDISGFHVDPGYHGRLLFSVLNAGPRPIHLRHNQPVFLIWYADLDRVTKRKKKNRGFEQIEPSIVNGISGEILSLQSLSKEIDSLRTQAAWRNRILWAIFVAVVSGVASLIANEQVPQFLDFLGSLF